MKNLKLFTILLMALIFCFFVYSYGFSEGDIITKKTIGTEIERIYKKEGTFVRFITHYQEDSSACVPARPECDLYRTKKSSYKEYFLDKTALAVSDDLLLNVCLGSKDNLFQRNYLTTYFKEKFWTQYFDFEEKRLVKNDNILYLETKIVSEDIFSWVYFLSFFFILFYSFRLFYVIREYEDIKTSCLGSLIIFGIISFLIFVHIKSDTELTYELPLFFIGVFMVLVIVDALDVDNASIINKSRKTILVFMLLVISVMLLNFLTFKDYTKMIVTFVFSVFSLSVPFIYQLWINKRKIKQIG